jgi:hypothetical protein
MRRRGDIIFEELSDELQWNFKKTMKSESTVDRKDRPGFQARLALREYTTSIDLPLSRGRNGSLFYVPFNIILLIIFLIAYGNI